MYHYIRLGDPSNSSLLSLSRPPQRRLLRALKESTRASSAHVAESSGPVLRSGAYHVRAKAFKAGLPDVRIFHCCLSAAAAVPEARRLGHTCMIGLNHTHMRDVSTEAELNDLTNKRMNE